MNSVWRALWPELKPYRGRMALVILFGVCISSLKAVTPELLGRLPDAWKNGDTETAYIIPLLIAGAWMLAALLRYFHMYWMLYIAELIAMNLRRRLMDKYVTLNLSFFHKFVRGSGGLISRMLNDIGLIQGGFQRFADIVREPFMIVFSLGYLLYIDWRLTLFLVLAAPAMSVMLRKFALSARKYARMNQESAESFTQILKESLDGTRVVQSFNLQNEMRTRFDEKISEYLSARAKMISREEASGPASEALGSVFVAMLLTYIGHQALQSQLAVGDFLSFMSAVGLLSDSVRKIQNAQVRMQQSAVALERLLEILEETEVVKQVASPRAFPKDWQSIDFKNVSFGYGDTVVLRGVNLNIRRGEQIALVGSSGAGKSTLINLLPRFFDPTEGQISIGGVPIHDMGLNELRAHVALVTQDVFLFSDSVARNIWSGDFGKPADGIEAAARMANAHDFIVASEEGYNTRMGERGARFSGGEKQRISIARAIFKDAPILILDEATSALDSESELEVQKGLDHLMKGRTALIIAHRLSTIAKCDRILVMDKGQFIEEGNHNELMVRQGAYYKFFQLQSRL